MTKDEALELALEALERSVATCFDQYAHQQVMSQPDHFINKAITAVKEALAQPEQEPVAIRYDFDGYGYQYIDSGTGSDWQTRVQGEPLYTTPPQRKPLTDEEMKKIWYAMQNIRGWYSFQEIARAIEAAHGIKE